MKKTLLLLLLLPFCFAAAAEGAIDRAWVERNYRKTEYRIPMRDGVRLHTTVYAPCDTAGRHPILLTRTPYSCRPYGAEFSASLWKSFLKLYLEEGYILVFQDVRGRYMSEGEYVDLRPFIADKHSPEQIDEASDAYDTIDFLVREVAGNNGRVGVYGNSYPGFYALMAAASGHPALKAASPQAPVTDWFMGDDTHHNGVLFLRDPVRFPDLNHAIKRDPRTGMRSVDNNWDFWTLLPEALHQVTITMSTRGIPASFRHMHGFGSHTYSFYDAENRRTWVKFHLRTMQGIRNLTDAEAEAVIAKDRESHQRDLFEAIERGDFPRWLFQIQTMTEEEARNYRINPFDLTKVWPHGDFPLQDVGILELNRNPENFYAEVEQAAFNPLNIVDGIGFSPDKMLQGRLFSYGDAQRYRLGVNLDQIPVNRPRVAVHSYHRDGAMRVDGNFGATVSYTPNSYGVWSDSPELKEPPLPLHGPVDNYDERAYDDDYYSQPGALFRLMTPEEKQALFENTARAMGDCKLFIKQRHVRNCYRADPAYGRGLADALGIALDEALDEKNDPALHPAAAMV